MIRFRLFVLIALCVNGVALAQQAAIERARVGAPAVAVSEASAALKMIAEERGEVVEIQTQAIQAPLAAPTKFRATLQSNLEYQTNAALNPDHNVGDWLWTPSFELGCRQPLPAGLSLDVAARVDLAQYFELDDSSYWGPSATGILEWRGRQAWPRFYAGSQVYRYDLIDPSREITRAVALVAGTDHSWQFHEGRTVVSAGYQFAKYWASPESEERSSHAMFAGVTRQLRGPWFVHASYAWQFSHFEQRGREDSRHVASAGLIYVFNPNTLLRLTASYVRNESTFPLADYENFSTGLGAALTLRF